MYGRFSRDSVGVWLRRYVRGRFSVRLSSAVQLRIGYVWLASGGVGCLAAVVTGYVGKYVGQYDLLLGRPVGEYALGGAAFPCQTRTVGPCRAYARHGPTVRV